MSTSASLGMNAPAPLICLMGPTGAGKTAAALALAEDHPLTVINADSRQVYRDFPIITAQPTAQEQAVCPHRLFGCLPTQEALGAGEYARLARQCIAEEQAKGRRVALVGGTGLYFRSLLHGIAAIPPVPEAVQTAWRDRCAAEGSVALHSVLQQVDPPTAARLHPNDKQRICRALEVHEATGKPLSWWHARPVEEPAFPALCLSLELPLAELEPRLGRRIDLMLEAGALEEAEAALAGCDDPSAPGWSGIGCRELYAHLREGLSLTDCKDLWMRNTRAYAKRQLTWFRAEKNLTRLAPQDIPQIRALARAHFR